jgi:hypothetical protein
MMKCYCLGFLLWAAAFCCFGQTKEEDITKLIGMTMVKNIVSQLTTNYTKITSAAPPEFWESLIKKLDFDGFLQDLIPFYDRYFTHKEIKKLLIFYESPLGQKMVSFNIDHAWKVMEINLEWGTPMAPVILEKLQKAGYY